MWTFTIVHHYCFRSKIYENEKGDLSFIANQGGQTLGYSQNSGVKILTIDGFAFKDLNKNGKLDKFEDWRLSYEARTKDLATQLSIEQIAGLMLYSRHQALPARPGGYFWGTYIRKGGTGYVPISLQYGEYTATEARETRRPNGKVYEPQPQRKNDKSEQYD